MLVPRLVTGIFAVGTMILGAGTVSGQDYPSKPIRFVTSAVGGGNDIQTRIIAPVISPPLGQPVIVDNRGGSLLSSEAVSKAPADGYTLLYNGQSMWLTPLLQKVPYDMRDFAAISQVTREIYILTVHPSLPVKSVKELIALAKARPGQLNYGSSIPGSNGHLAGELFKSLAGVNIVWVPYKGTAPAITAEISGEVQMTIANPGAVLPQMQAGKLKALAVTSPTPSALFPGLPTVAASGVPDFEMISMTGVFVPAKTAPEIINRINQEIVRALNLPEVKEKFLKSGVEAVSSSPEQFGAAVKADMSRISKVIKDANIKVD